MLREKNINRNDIQSDTEEFEIQDFELEGQLLFDIPFETGIMQIEDSDKIIPNKKSDTPTEKSDVKTITDKRMALIGYSVMVFALVGLILIIKLGISLMDNVDTDTTEEKILNFVKPMVVADIKPFENNVEIDDKDLITLSIWNYILNLKNSSEAFTEVRQEEIELQTKYIFGSLIPLSHQTVSVGGSQFVYNSDTKTYTVPLDVYFYSYYPKIKDIDLNDKQYRVEVEYWRDTPKWVNNAADAPVKVLTYTIDTSDGYELVSIK
ncbi:MAG: hypothetical protein LBL93_07735 [Ruminococcus sp.]|jgi:hypothetical protein|nr:hypothetical protein [Ruminococcus sp.]